MNPKSNTTIWGPKTVSKNFCLCHGGKQIMSNVHPMFSAPWGLSSHQDVKRLTRGPCTSHGCPTWVLQADPALRSCKGVFRLAYHVPQQRLWPRCFLREVLWVLGKLYSPQTQLPLQQDEFQVPPNPGDWRRRPGRLGRRQRQFQNLVCSAKRFYLLSPADCSWHWKAGLTFQICSPGKNKKKSR